MDAEETDCEKINLSVSSEVIRCWASQTQCAAPRKLEGNRREDQIPTSESREGLMGGIIAELSVKRE